MYHIVIVILIAILRWVHSHFNIPSWLIEPINCQNLRKAKKALKEYFQRKAKAQQSFKDQSTSFISPVKRRLPEIPNTPPFTPEFYSTPLSPVDKESIIEKAWELADNCEDSEENLSESIESIDLSETDTASETKSMSRNAQATSNLEKEVQDLKTAIGTMPDGVGKDAAAQTLANKEITLAKVLLWTREIEEAYPDGLSTDRTDLIGAYLSGLNDCGLARSVANKGPDSSEDAMAKVSQKHQGSGLIRQKTPIVATHAASEVKANPLEKEVAALTAAVAQLVKKEENQQTASVALPPAKVTPHQPRSQKTSTCFRCGKTGHFARECYTKVESSRPPTFAKDFSQPR